jgi:Cof subfamily protein (haloacid dehalogenase superfamily)
VHRAGQLSTRLIVTDLDGTLLDPNGKVHEVDAEAVRRLRSLGVIVTICTGRMYSGTRAIARELGISGPVACVDGCHIVDGRTDATLCVHTLPVSAAEGLRRLLAERELATFVFSSDTIIHDHRGAQHLSYLSTWSERMQAVPELLDEAAWDGLPEKAAVVALGDRVRIEQVAENLDRASRDTLQVVTFALRKAASLPEWALIARRGGIDKGTATRFLAEYHHVDLADVIVVGDWVNDVSMFAVAGRSFVMSQAPSEVKQVASDMLRANVWSGGGIREAAKRAGLL